LNQNKARSSPTRKLKRILLIGDSHVRGCVRQLGKYLGPDYQVSETVMPGSRLQNIIKFASNEITGISKEGFVISWVGSNDVNRNDLIKGLMNLNEFIDKKKQHKYHDSNNPT
jgi:ribosomal protein L1